MMKSAFAICLVTAIALAMPVAAAMAQEDELSEHQHRVEAQQAEDRRMNEIATQMNEDVAEMQAGEPGEPRYAPNSFVSFPPEAWNEWVGHNRQLKQDEEAARFGKDPTYQALLRGVWTYRQSAPGADPATCEATFWTRHGGVSFIHFGGKDELTLLGFFGGTIPAVKRPQMIRLELIQAGEAQQVRAINLHFGSLGSMGMVLFNVHSPEILIGAIEERQDFEVRLAGETIAKGEWHSGHAARDQLAACLKRQGYFARM